MSFKKLEESDIKNMRIALRKKSRADAEMRLIIADLEDKYDFSLEIDRLDMVKGVIEYAESNNADRPIDTARG